MSYRLPDFDKLSHWLLSLSKYALSILLELSVYYTSNMIMFGNTEGSAIPISAIIVEA